MLYDKQQAPIVEGRASSNIFLFQNGSGSLNIDELLQQHQFMLLAIKNLAPPIDCRTSITCVQVHKFVVSIHIILIWLKGRSIMVN